MFGNYLGLGRDGKKDQADRKKYGREPKANPSTKCRWNIEMPSCCRRVVELSFGLSALRAGCLHELRTSRSLTWGTPQAKNAWDWDTTRISAQERGMHLSLCMLSSTLTLRRREYRVRPSMSHDQCPTLDLRLNPLLAARTQILKNPKLQTPLTASVPPRVEEMPK